MKALTFCGGREIHYEEVSEPTILDPRDAIVQVSRTAICGSDLHVYHERERGLDRGTVMGHEFVGTVVAVGSDVNGLSEGDRVASPFTTNCGACFYCRGGLTARCLRGQLYGWVEGGKGLHGAQAELVRVPLADSTLFAIPDGVDEDQALLLGDVLSTGYFCAEMAGVRPDGVYAVLGCGPVGLMGILGARLLGAERIYAVDSVPERLRLAEEFGATPIDFGASDPIQVLLEATEGRGADAAMELVGNRSAGRLAYDIVRPGGTISVVGVHNDPAFAFTPAEAYDKNLTFRVGRCPVRRIMPQLVPLLQEKAIDPGRIITHRLALHQGPAAYEMFDAKAENCIKVVLDPSRT